MKHLLFSSSRVGDSGYLEQALPAIRQFCGTSIRRGVFVPYAGVSVSFDSYLQQVNTALAPIELRLESLHQAKDKSACIEQADLIVVGGGNTFALLHRLQKDGVLELIRRRCLSMDETSLPYIGWSAGSNISAPTICTTNDMPIVQPDSFEALGLLPFQINPHYIEGNPPGHNGETREQRLLEFLQLNPEQTVVALPEGCWLLRENAQLIFAGLKSGYIFRRGVEREEILPQSDLSRLLTDAV